MFKHIVSAALMSLAVSAFAAVDVNKADQTQLDAVKGVGPQMSTRILEERKRGSYKDWNDLIARVQGIGDRSAARLSKEGLTVNGATYQAMPATKPATGTKQ